MSLRAIQKRDREKLSSSQRQQQQQQFINHQQRNSPGVGVTAPLPALPYVGATAALTVTQTAAMKMTTVPSVQAIIQSQHAKRKQQHAGATAPSVLTRTVSSTLRRCSSCPALPTVRHMHHTRKQQQRLRSVRSESEISALRDHLEGTVDRRSGVGVATVGDSFSSNNLFLGAKSEVCLKTLAVKNTLLPSFGKTGAMQQQQQQSSRSLPSSGSIRGSGDAGGGSGGSTQTSKRLYESRRASELSSSDFGTSKSELHLKANASAVRIPIVGYEVMEERARFTIFKLRIENSISHTCWLVLRRYTDFVRLNNKLKTVFPHCNLVLPRKKWFGDNFSTGFIDNRIQGLQVFINTILGDDVMRTCQAVRDFFCLDEPPSYSESMEESRVIFEAQEETISQLKQQLQAKEEMMQALQTKLASELNRNNILANVIRNSVENCAKCSKSADQLMKESVYK
ncbi:uncharacterized protein LOC128727123 [Anopheles nili]|uniref:uncharacterized protein LOC128727123 n=1 Tax=Anopheles nili TaxID=185578 RepID=UPI00237BCC21|nr:uncharacterized protein LOC128727123 [Anopheles nili]